MQLLDASELNIINLRKAILYDFIDPEQFPLESTGLIFRGIGQKELDFIRKHGYIASKGKGNNADQEKTTCFSQLFSQAEGYARSQYDLYNEVQGYVLAVKSPMTALENELGEIEVVGQVPASAIKAIMPIDQLNKAMKADKTITRAEAKKVHKDLPPGGEWRTMNGHHIYIKNGKVLAGAIPGATGAKKATKAHLAEHQATIDRENKQADTGGVIRRKDLAKKTTPTPKTTKAQEEAKKTRKAIDELAGNNAKAEAKVPKKSVKETMAKNKKDIDLIIANPNKKVPQGKSATKEDLDNLVKENAKNNNKSTAKGATKKDIDEMTKAPKKTAPKPVTKEDLDEMFGLPKSSKPTRSKKSESKKEEVAVIRSEKQANHDVAYDVGKKIGGARKDEAQIRKAVENLVGRSSGQSLEQLEKISPELAQKHCIKKNLLSSVDFEAEHKRGTAINVAVAKQLIYDRIIPKPAGDTPKDRAEYLNAIKNIERALEPVKGWDELREATRNLGDRMKKENPRYVQDQLKYIEYAQKKLKEDKPSAYELMKFDRATHSEVPITKEEWRKGQQARIDEYKANIKKAEEAIKNPFSPLGEKFMNFFTDLDSRQRTYDTIAKKKLDWGTYFKEDKASEPKAKRGEANKKKWERIMPAKIQRTGGRVSKVEKPEDMIKNFGFSGVEFGNWVDDVSGNFHMKKCAEAFQDLADIIGIKDKDVSLNGRLSMAFGARGQGGALAHYEPASKVINITKEGGAGSLAHEWGHAMDNMMYQQSAGRSSLNYASDGMGDEGSPEVKQAYKDVMHEIMFGKGLGKSTVPNKNNEYYSYHRSFRQAVQELGLEGAIKKGTEMINADAEKNKDYYDTFVRGHYGAEKAEEYIKKTEAKRVRALNDMIQEMAYHHEKLTGEHLDEIPAYSGHSQYYVDSSKQGGKDNKYWTSQREMFARAFENYIEGKVKSGKVKNDYLVHGTYASMPGVSAPYPQGEERDAIHKAFDKLMEAIRSSGAIKKAIEIEELEKSFYNLQDLKARAEAKDQRNRNAYNVPDASEVFFIPINRLKCEYQTEEALNFDKIKENVEKMKNGDYLMPVVIGYDYDVHDGHHRIEASKILNYTHVPCVVGGSNYLDIQRAKEAYAEVWKSLNTGKISREEAKGLHKDLPEGGVWRTMRGHHIYIKDGKVLAGAVPGMKGAKKATKEQLKEHQHTINAEGSRAPKASEGVQNPKKPLYSNNKRGDDKPTPKNKEGVSNMSKKGAGKNERTEAGTKTGTRPGNSSKAGTDGQGRSGATGKEGMGQSQSGSPSQSVRKPVIDYKTAKPKDFHSAIAKAKANNDHGAFVDLHDVDDYSHDKLLMSPEGGAGVAVTPDGNIVSVFKDPTSTEKGAMHSIMMNAIKHGGKKLDCFDGYLPINYARYGMVPVAKLKFNREYAPEGWNFERDGEPDVIFMAHNGDSLSAVQKKFGTYDPIDLSKVPYVDEYDDGIKAQEDFLKNNNPQPPKGKKSKKEEAKASSLGAKFAWGNLGGMKKVTATQAKDAMKLNNIPVAHREHILNELEHETTHTKFYSKNDDFNNGRTVKGKLYKASDVEEAVAKYRKDPSIGKQYDKKVASAKKTAETKARKEAEAKEAEAKAKVRAEVEAKAKAENEKLQNEYNDWAVKNYATTDGEFDPLKLMLGTQDGTIPSFEDWRAGKIPKPSKEDLSKLSDDEIENRYRAMEKKFEDEAEAKYAPQRKAVKDKLQALKRELREVDSMRKSKKKDAEVSRITKAMDEASHKEQELYQAEYEHGKQGRGTDLHKELVKRREKRNREQDGTLLPEEEKTLDKKIGAKPFDPKASEEYYYRHHNGQGWDKRAVKSVPVDLGHGIEGFITHREDNSEFVVHEAKTGQPLAYHYPNDTKQSTEELMRQAVNQAKLKFADSGDTFKKKIEAINKTYGISPRYAQNGEAKADKKQVKPKAEKKAETNPYHIFIRKNDGSDMHYEPVEGAKKVDLGHGFEGFLHKYDNGWRVSEAKSGLSVTTASTKEEAIAKAKQGFEANHERLGEMINAHVEKHGASPKVK